MVSDQDPIAVDAPAEQPAPAIPKADSVRPVSSSQLIMVLVVVAVFGVGYARYRRRSSQGTHEKNLA
jgi:hypothetical protein